MLKSHFMNTSRIILTFTVIILSNYLFSQGVGINTDGTDPIDMLHVKTSAASSADGIMIENPNGGNGDATITLRNNGSVDEWTFGFDDSDNDDFKISKSASLGTTNALTIDGNTRQILSGTAGTAGDPSWSFESDDNTGMYNSAGNQISWSTAASERLRLTSSQLATTFNGTVSVPAYSFTGDNNVGIYRSAADNLSITTAGTETMRSNTTVTSFMREIQTRQTNASSGDILVRIYDSSDDGIIDIYENNAMNHRIHGNGTTIFNEQGLDLDFRIEGNTQTQLFRIDAGNNSIGLHEAPNATTVGGVVVDRVAYPIEIGSDGAAGTQATIGWWNGAEVEIMPETANYGYVGSAANYWYYMYSNNFVNVSTRDTKRDFIKIDENKAANEYLMTAIDNMSPYFYKYKAENDKPEEGMGKYRPQYHLGVIVDESPDVIKDVAFSGIDIYGLSVLSLNGVKHNRAEIKKLKPKTANDFGTITTSNRIVKVKFSSEFSNQLENAQIPVITASTNKSDVTISIIEKTKLGFTIELSKVTENINIDWISFAKISEQTEITYKDLDKSIINKLEITDETKEKLIEYHKRTPTKEMEPNKQ